MPDARPLPSLRPGAYDDPPASSEASTPQTRRQRLGRAILGTNDLAPEVINMANAEQQGRRSTVGGITGRRQRSRARGSGSEHDELSTGTPEGEHLPRRRLNKRRRLNSGQERPTKKAIKYGYYGQVEPGKLKLDLVSCDGGEHVDARHPETSLSAENLLRHDKSVYCSERPQSNIFLRHADDTAFCLEKLHIVGPEMGFTAPVRAGVVYVGMTMADLQKYLDPPPHARLSHHSPYRRRRLDVESPSSSPELLSVAEALRDPYISAAHDAWESGGAPETDAVHGDAQRRGYVPYEDSADADVYCDSNPATDPHAWLHDAQTNTYTRRSQPITILSDEDAGPEERSPQEVLDYRSQRERLMRRSYDIENWHRTRGTGGAGGRGGRGDTDHWSYVSTPPTERDREREGERERENITTIPLARLLARQRMRDSPSSSGDDSVPLLKSVTPEPAASRPHGEAGENVTVARFHIRKGKYKVAIKFDPPVSGRFVLLKFWAGKSNVDVQSVVAKGFMGGMRFFPAVDVR